MAERIIDRADSLSGPEKAAALMLSLPAEHVATLFEKLDQTEIHEISQIMSTLGKVRAEAMESVFVEFSENLSSTGNLRGTFDSTERLLSKALDGERAKSIMNEIRGPAGRTVWDNLSNVNEGVLANYLKNEYPQTVAVVLSKIRPDHASKVFSKFSEEFSREVIERMLRMDTVKREVIENIEKTLKTEFMSNSAKAVNRDSHEIVANIFDSFDRATESKYMSFLEERLPDSAEKIKSLMFTFDDLIRLEPAGVQAVIRFADKSRLVMALKGSSETIKDLFFGNMSERAAKLMKEDMEALGMVRLKDVEEAQLEVVNLTKSMADKGEIKISDGNSEEEMVG
jgi:flagellar motor switch protein FliG